MLQRFTAAAVLLLAPAASAQDTFANPVIEYGEDPWVIQHDGMYYYVFGTGPNHTGEYSQLNAVWIRGSQSLVDVFQAEATQAWEPPRDTMYSEQLWAPELHFHDDAWWLYIAGDNGNNDYHRTQVLRRDDADPRGEFELVGQLQLPEHKWAIDATLFEHNDTLYCVWSGWPGWRNEQQNLYICEMLDPATPIGPRAIVSEPELDWERRGGGPGLPWINEGPDVFTHDGRTFMIYAASGSWSDFYCLGLLELTGENPMDPDAWTKHPDVWLETDNGVIAPGHASVTMSPDGSEYWLVYHSAKYEGAGWDRHVNINRIQFDDEGLPYVEMSAPGEQVPVPAGE